MIQILHNSKTESYKQLKKIILSDDFSWHYQETTTTNDDLKYEGHQNVCNLGHNFLIRPEINGYSKVNSKGFSLAMNVVREILSENGFPSDTYFFLRINANCSIPVNGDQFSIPHIDHDFPHVNFLSYLTDTGGRTFVEGEEHDPKSLPPVFFRILLHQIEP